jgi:hypothetical protein
MTHIKRKICTGVQIFLFPKKPKARFQGFFGNKKIHHTPKEYGVIFHLQKWINLDQRKLIHTIMKVHFVKLNK